MDLKITQNELQFVRIKTKKRELMMGVGASGGSVMAGPLFGDMTMDVQP